MEESSPHKIIPNLVLALSAWVHKFEADPDVLTTHKTLILGFLEGLQEMSNSMKQIRHLYETQIDDHPKFVMAEAVDCGQEHESRVYEFIENCCGEMMAWNLADSTEAVDAEGDVDEDDELYESILDNPTELKELTVGIQNGNQERKEIIDKYS